MTLPSRSFTQLIYPPHPHLKFRQILNFIVAWYREFRNNMTKSGNHDSFDKFIRYPFVGYLYKRSMELGNKDFSSCLWAELPDNLQRSGTEASSRTRSSRTSLNSSASTTNRNGMVQSHTDAAVAFSDRMKSSVQQSSMDRYYKLLDKIPHAEGEIDQARIAKKAAPEDSSERKNLGRLVKSLKLKRAAMMSEKELLVKSLDITEKDVSSSDDESE